MQIPTPGSFFLTTIDGWTGRWVSAAQAFVRGGNEFTHAGLILDHDEFLEAEPGGAQINPIKKLASYTLHHRVLLCDAPMRMWAKNNDALMISEGVKRHELVTKARYMKDIPYSFLDYGALAMTEFKVPGWQLVRDRVESSEHLICSALVDRAFMWADIHLFNDGRLPGDVTPGDLAKWVTDHA